MQDSPVKHLHHFIDIEEACRNANTIDELRFITINKLKKIISYDSSVYFSINSNTVSIDKISGISEFDKNSDFCKQLESDISSLIDDQHVSYAQLNTSHFAILLFNKNQSKQGILLKRETPYTEDEKLILSRIHNVFNHALIKFDSHKINRFNIGHKKITILLILLLFIFLFPVKQSLTVPAEVISLESTPITAPDNGVIENIHVNAGEQVSKDKILIEYNKEDYKKRLDIAKEELFLAKEKLRKATQKSFYDREYKIHLSDLKLDVEIKSLNFEHLKSKIDELSIKSPYDGVVRFDKKEVWLGRPVNIGDKIMEVAKKDSVLLQIEVPTNDAIYIDENTLVEFYIGGSAWTTYKAKIDSVNFLPTFKEGVGYIFRVNASFVKEKPELGSRGFSVVYGQKTSLFFNWFRKPIFLIRKFFAF